MKRICILHLSVYLFTLITLSCAQEKNKEKITTILNTEEYTRLMTMTPYDFDQAEDGFRKHWRNYELIRLLIPEYIEVNQLSANESGNLHWHLGQMHASNDNTEEAIAEMKLSYRGDHVTWDSYVKGTIAFLEKDRTSLLQALDTLRKQENQMNIQILENMIKNFGKTYKEASNSN